MRILNLILEKGRRVFFSVRSMGTRQKYRVVQTNLLVNIQNTLPARALASSGWGDDITWVQTYEEGLFHIQKSNKPLMVIHHLEDCQYSQDPSLTVRADLTGKYSNRLYTYEPQDLPVLIENMKKALKLIQSEL
ncbi:anterior gradient protein 3 isoform X4 [Equus przewalskii]|uniref:Anterior gradient protein 3 isoform X4 n=1 Tax=Equus przewalskii TaxID=9798 RepID=A0ABM4P424_EQUPR